MGGAGGVARVRHTKLTMVSSISGATLEKAIKELGEDPEKRLEVIGELRDKLTLWQPDPKDPDEQGLTLHRIEDDKFLLCFLRARKFDVERATKLFVNYYKYRAKHSSMLGEISPEAAKPTLKSNIISVLPNCTKDGCKVLVANLGAFDLEEHPIEHMLKMMLVILDELIQDEETQVHGMVLCDDLAALTLYKMMVLARQEQVAKGLMMQLVQVRTCN